ncbi:MAG: hypothetical protein NT098_05260 [Candidatus Parcubacteria bacterium]|nr:hypothetical protein [Candidatus Parcubacteria bacterium]
MITQQKPNATQNEALQKFLKERARLLGDKKKKPEVKQEKIVPKIVPQTVNEETSAKITDVPFVESSRITVSKPAKKKSENNDFHKDTRFRFIDPSAVEDREILFDYLEWIAHPRKERKPQTQKEFAENHGIHYNTVTTWKWLPGFWDEVKIRRDVIFRKYTTEILYALMERAKTGSVREVELFVRLFEGYSDKVEIENRVPTELSEEKLAEIRQAVHNIGMTAILEGLETASEENSD